MKEIVKNCPVCRLRRRKLTQQIMADIPSHQLYPCPPFSHVSLDYAGPFSARAMGNSRAQLKVWGLVIVCQNTRAVRMYAAAGYATDDFLTAYTRFTANHGNPLLVVSDSGSQLMKAAKHVDQFDLSKLDWVRIKEGAARNGTEWKVVQPGCQWRNGLAEAAVKLVKSTLYLTLASQKALNYAELDTLFSSVSNIVNQRPIGVKHFTEEDYVAITPNDLLLGRSRNTIPGIQYLKDETLTKRQEFMMEVEDLWWKQWYVQVFPSLVPFKKWRKEERNIQIGDIVLVMYEKSVGKGDYRLARVLSVYPDVHDVVRTVKVGFRRRSVREATLPYVPKPLDEMELGVQRLVVVSPVEEQKLEKSEEHTAGDSSEDGITGETDDKMDKTGDLTIK